ncbi:MAG: anti-sigma factor [Armatimonadetes bacterium]|jgi:anti-sigma factor (TIGR02949 family)|nr:anti-sigma factor [Armatimonadota bacterium]
MHDSLDFDTCLGVMQALDDYLSRELTPEEARQVDEHLELCELCMSHFQFERALVMHIRKKAQEVRAPATLRARVLSMLDQI